MKILVIDDNPLHQQSAHQTLGADNDLTVVTTHDEALEALDTYKNKYLPADSYWDAVLSDLLMPAGKYKQGIEGRKFVGSEMPIGWSLAITAALNGARYVAVVTDMSHHDHPGSAMLNGIDRGVFSLNSARALFTNHISMAGIEGTEKTCVECDGSGKQATNSGNTFGCPYCHATGTDYDRKGKDWAKVLQKLVTEL